MRGEETVEMPEKGGKGPWWKERKIKSALHGATGASKSIVAGMELRSVIEHRCG